MSHHSVGSSDVGDYEEDPNIPADVDVLCGGSKNKNSEDQQQQQEGEQNNVEDDNISISSELSDQSMKHYGLDYDCRPDISEVANLTHAVNYGDFANMARDHNHGSLSQIPGVFLDPVYFMGGLDDDGAFAAENPTWSQLLDNEGRQQQPQHQLGVAEQSSKSFLWTQGYDETKSLSGVSLVFPEAFSKPYKFTRRSSDNMSVRSLGLLQNRPRPINAIKRFLARRSKGSGGGGGPPRFVKAASFHTTDTRTTNSQLRVEVAKGG